MEKLQWFFIRNGIEHQLFKENGIVRVIGGVTVEKGGTEYPYDIRIQTRKNTFYTQGNKIVAAEKASFDCVVKCKIHNRPHFKEKPCSGNCGHIFAKDDPVFICEDQVSNFRGDDVVTAFCVNCGNAMKLKGS